MWWTAVLIARLGVLPVVRISDTDSSAIWTGEAKEFQVARKSRIEIWVFKNNSKCVRITLRI